MTNKERYEKFTQKNNLLKDYLIKNHNQHAIFHIDTVDLKKNRCIVTTKTKKVIDESIDTVVSKIMKNEFCVSNPSALASYDFGRLVNTQDNSKP